MSSITLAGLACLAGVMGLPAPTVLPTVEVLSFTRVKEICGEKYIGCHRAGHIIYPEGQIRDTTRPHEMAHYIRWSSKQYLPKWQRENEARWASRRYHTWCGEVKD